MDNHGAIKFAGDLQLLDKKLALASDMLHPVVIVQTDLTYRDIHDATGVSTTTIVRVARFLRQEPYQAYQLAIDRMGSNDDAR